MRDFGQVLAECVSPANRKIEDVDTRIRELQDGIAALRAQRPGLDAEVEELRRRRAGQEGPMDALRASIDAMEAQICEIRRRKEESERRLAEMKVDAEHLVRQVRAGHDHIQALDRDIDQSQREIAALERAREDATARLREARRRALSAYAAETFEGFVRFATEATATERVRDLRVEYELACEDEPDLRDARDRRREAMEALSVVQNDVIRRVLQEEVRRAEMVIEARFPGVLAADSAVLKEEMVEALYCYDAEDDVTRLFLPLPVAVAEAPPTATEDPRTRVLKGLLWAVARAVPEATPHVDVRNDLVVLEWHGDESVRFGGRTFEVSVGEDRRVTLLGTPLAADVREVLR